MAPSELGTRSRLPPTRRPASLASPGRTPRPLPALERRGVDRRPNPTRARSKFTRDELARPTADDLVKPDLVEQHVVAARTKTERARRRAGRISCAPAKPSARTAQRVPRSASLVKARAAQQIVGNASHQRDEGGLQRQIIPPACRATM